MRHRILIALLAFAALVTIPATTAEAKGKPVSIVPVISVYNATSDANSATSYAVRQWNKATNVQLVQVNEPCSGPSCIMVRFVDAHDPGTCGNFIGGCEYSSADGTIQVTVTNNMYLVTNRKVDQNRLMKSVTLHEIGHGLGLDHRDPNVDPDTAMGSMISACCPIMSPSAQDLVLVDEAWADGYEAPAA